MSYILRRRERKDSAKGWQQRVKGFVRFWNEGILRKEHCPSEGKQVGFVQISAISSIAFAQNLLTRIM